MGYWFFLLILFALMALMIFMLYSEKKKDNDCYFGAGIAVCCIIGVMLIGLCIDIPSALAGGQKIYVNDVPQVVNTGHFQFVCAGGKCLISYSGFNPADYEPDTQYCISYTKFTKSFLDIEKVE